MIDAAAADMIRAMVPVLREYTDGPGTWSGQPTQDHGIKVLISAVAIGVSNEPGEYFPDEAIRMARITVEELGVEGALKLANDEYPPDPTGWLYSRYTRAFESNDGDRLDMITEYMRAARAYDRAGVWGLGQQHRVEPYLAGMLDVYLTFVAPSREPRPEDRARVEAIIDSALAERDKQRAMGFDDDDPVAT